MTTFIKSQAIILLASLLLAVSAIALATTAPALTVVFAPCAVVALLVAFAVYEKPMAVQGTVYNHNNIELTFSHVNPFQCNVYKDAEGNLFVQEETGMKATRTNVVFLNCTIA